MSDGSCTVRLEIQSVIDELDRVQVVTNDIARRAGLDGDELDWWELAVREAVINAIEHGNHNDPEKRVFIEFATTSTADSTELSISIRDQGAGFDPDQVADPLAPDNLLKTSGRGVFLMKQFMDDLTLQRAPGGGMEVRLIKRIPH